ncbi:hypothetical protein H6S82_01740 [Planktothrix sp. FACHB-1355]|uniref:Uncharacterized protein n=1 Tax=Aerosakkonema funiforme FACHB-1375 TaxID=2949571 RepID=A0A926VM26_9CYAN|nr:MULTISPECIES: hypothetical protein [Oscillatoriales]MBD2184949.1 hypothetical protein [Aerosakkonema funiforme FACHB-1375]MBD3557590.1 hypothetical protein [Planktothrix sp. FACHB-1355]
MGIKTTEELLALLESKLFSGIKDEITETEISYTAYKLAVNFYELVNAIWEGEHTNQTISYEELKGIVWEYQRQHQISGVIIETVHLGNKTYRFPVALKELLVLESDLDILKAAVPRVIEAFTEYANSRPIYLCYTAYDKWDAEHHIQTTLEYIKHEATYADWAEITVDDDTNVSLSLGWGNPNSSVDLDDLEGDKIAFEAITSCPWNIHLKIKGISEIKGEIIIISQEEDFDFF